MNHRTAPSFWRYNGQLPKAIQRAADKNFQLLKLNPQHPSLQFKKTSRYYSVRVTNSYRALAIEDHGDMVWFWIGVHDEYDRRLK